MGAWTKVVTEPLGLAAFALFLMFAYIGKVKKGDERRWLSPAAFACAAATLIGGLTLAYLQSKPAAPASPVGKLPAPAAQQNQQVQQQSSGAGSPNVQGVQGDVTITVDQSKGNTQPQKPQGKKDEP